MAKVFKKGDTAPDFTATDSRGDTFKLSDFNGKKNVVLVFLRYLGCPLCQMSIAELKSRYQEFVDKDTEVVVFVQSPQKRLEKEGYADAFPFHIIPDPDETFYNLYHVGSGKLRSMINGEVIGKALRATLKGYMQGKMEGNTFQLPGDFIVGKDGVLKLAHIGKNVSDNLKISELLSHL